MNLVDRAKNIILKPKEEWEVIGAEEPNVGQIMTGYVIPLAILPAVAVIIGYGVVGFLGFRSFTYGIASGIISLLVSIGGVYLTAFVVDALAGSFNSQKNLGRAIQLVAYSYTPVWIGGILNIFPALSWLGMLFGLYGLYLMYLGLPKTMQTPEDKVVVYLIVSIIVLIVVYFILSAILTSILFGIFGLSMLSAISGM